MSDTIKFYNKIGSQIGWDFSNIKVKSEGVKWKFYDEVKKRARKNDVLLDMGTGGGEKVLNLSKYFRLIIGIDNAGGMIKTAFNNLAKSSVTNCKFFCMNNNGLLFPDKMFDIVSCRHSDYSPEETYRVLIDGGLFLTQQVSEADKINIKEFFGCGQNYGIKDGTQLNRYNEELKKAGFLKIKTLEYNAAEYYKSPEDIIFLLNNTPVLKNSDNNEIDFKKLDDFIKQNISKKGIKTNSKRFMIIAEK